ncbi:MAG: glycosyltransferase family 39 protein [Elusimicrobia bacterium]|nr:glycosyltransferase family 39 protein [Elusimicrobiota bacterium]
MKNIIFLKVKNIVYQNKNIFKKKYIIFLFFWIISYLTISFFYIDKYPSVYGDEALYSEPCLNFLKEGKFSTTLYYPPGVGGFDQSNLIHGRIFNLIQVILFKIFGVSIITIRLQSFIASILVLLFTALLGLKLMPNSPTGIYSSFFLALTHPFIFSSHFSRPEMTTTLWILLSIYIFVLAEQKNSVILFFLSGLFAGTCIEIHPSGNMAIIMIALVALQQLFSKKINIKALSWLGLGICCGILIWFTLHVWIQNGLFMQQYAFIKIGHRGFLSRNPLLMVLDETYRWYSFFWEGAYHRNMFLLAIFIFAISHAFCHRKERIYSLLLCSLLGGVLGLLIGSPAKPTWYVIFIFPFLSILTTAALKDWFSCSFFNKTVSVGLISLLIVFFSIESSHRFKFYNSHYYDYIKKIKAFLPNNAITLATDNLWFGLKDHTRFIPHHYIGNKERMDSHGMAQTFYYGKYDDFLKRQKIEYVIADQEILGWPQNKHNLIPFLEKYGHLVATINDPFYNFSDYLSKKSPRPLITRIYKIILKKA